MLRLMGTDMLIASDVDGYVRTAIEVATNQTLNHDLRALIGTNKRVLFDRTDLNGQFVDALLGLASE